MIEAKAVDVVTVSGAQCSGCLCMLPGPGGKGLRRMVRIRIGTPQMGFVFDLCAECATTFKDQLSDRIIALKAGESG